MGDRVTESKRFRARDRMENQRVDYDQRVYYVDCIWFELLEGKKRGLQFAIPIEHPDYSSEKEDKLKSLDEGQDIVMSCRSVNKKDTSWVCDNIERLPE